MSRGKRPMRAHLNPKAIIYSRAPVGLGEYNATCNRQTHIHTVNEGPRSTYLGRQSLSSTRTTPRTRYCSALCTNLVNARWERRPRGTRVTRRTTCDMSAAFAAATAAAQLVTFFFFGERTACFPESGRERERFLDCWAPCRAERLLGGRSIWPPPQSFP